MIDSIGAYANVNGSIVRIADIRNAETVKKDVVYEVIRVIDGIPLFLEDHYSRMKNSIKIFGNSMEMPELEFLNRIKSVIEADNMKNCNVKIIIYEDSNNQNQIFYISKSYYPNEEEFSKGVKVSMLDWDRENPNIKIQNLVYKDVVQKKIEEANVFETLLINSDGKITEGSRSNVFFVKKNKIYTAPSEYILKGVTRKYIMDVCRRLDLEVIETLISKDSIDEMEGLFISGTSIKVLPVSWIDEKMFNSATHPSVIAAKNGFDSLIEEYVKERLISQ